MVKCGVCGNKLAETFLGKIKGSYVKDKGKTHILCFECQKKFKTKEEILKEIS